MDNNLTRMEREDEDGFLYNYDYHYVGPEDYEEESEYEEEYRPREKKKPKRLLVVIQLLVCATILFTAMLLRVVGGPAYTAVKSWYLGHINNSIIAQESFNRFTYAWVQFFSTEPAQQQTPQQEQQEPQPAGTEPSSGTAKPSDSKLVSHMAFTTNMHSSTPVLLSVFLDFPLRGGIITSPFGMRDGKPHLGIDIAAPEGSPIVPAVPGRVEFSGESSSYGKYLLIDHGSDIKTRYAHCETLLVKEGDAVVYGQPIAIVGNTGDSTGTHLHFELILSGVCYNPQPLLKNIPV